MGIKYNNQFGRPKSKTFNRDGVDLRVCKRCGEELTLDKFYHKPYGGIDYMCLDCRKIFNKETRLKKLNGKNK